MTWFRMERACTYFLVAALFVAELSGSVTAQTVSLVSDILHLV